MREDKVEERESRWGDGGCLIYDSSFPAMYGHLDLPNPFHGMYAFL